MSRGTARTSTTTSPPTTEAPATTTTTVEPPTTSTTYKPPPTTTAPKPTTTTTEQPRAPPEEAQAASTDDYQPYPECMEHGHFDGFSETGGHSSEKYAEMVRCWAPLVHHWSWPSVTKVFSVMYCESKGDPWAGPYHPYHGLMQIGPGGPFDPWDNMVEAWRKSSGGTNWGQWDCS